jgi:hypothetical protein
MKRGALAMFDALGFKGIWTRPELRDEPEKVIAKLEDLLKHANSELALTRDELRTLGEKMGARVEVDAILLSDTVAIGAWAESGGAKAASPEKCNWASLFVASWLTSSVLAHAARAPAPLAYRGCIAFGDFAIHERFIAAEAMDMADAALVWLAPTARRILHDAIRVEKKVATEPLLCTHSVPMKGGGTYRTWVVSPFDRLDSQEERDTYLTSVLATFVSDRIDIQIKRQNTAAFLIAESKRLARREARARATEVKAQVGKPPPEGHVP